MEIRARIALEVAKFQANAKVVAGQFKAMGTSAERFQNNVDHYAKRSLDTSKKVNADRVKDTSKTGQAILAKEKKLADDLYSARMQAFRRFEKDKSKLELNAVRPGSDGVVRGSVRPPARSRPVSDAEAKTSAILTAQMRKDFEKAYAAKEKAAQRAERIAQKEAAATQREAAKHIRLMDRENAAANAKLQKHYKDVQREIARTAAVAEKEGKKLALERYFKSEEFNAKLASTRYALYDLSRRAAAFGVAIGGAFALAVKSAIDFESAFTAVERTTQLSLNSDNTAIVNQAQQLRKNLIEITTEIPVSFSDITNIATLGAQLGIASDNIDSFTETVAKFSSITKISVDDVALSFGRLSQLLDVPADKFENLSSAIAFTGVNSVATDKEILRMSESIAAAATNAGFAAEDTIGFAAALASLKVRPEEARGVLARLFREFDISVGQGGSKLDDLSRIIGKTSEESAYLWERDPSQFFQSFLSGAEATGKLNETITALGITNTRELNVITRLAQNQDVLTKAIADSRDQFELGTFSTEAYGLVVDDIASKITMLQNSIAAMGSSFGSILIPVLGPVIDGLRSLVQSITELPAPVKVLIGIIGGLVAGLALISAAIAAGVAGLLALRLAFQNLTGPSVQAGLGITTLVQLIKSLLPASGAATAGLGILRGGLNGITTSFMAASAAARVFQVSLGVIGILATVGFAVATYAASVEDAKEKTKELANANFEAAGGIEAFKRASDEGIASGATVYGEITSDVEKLTDAQKQETEEALKAKVARAALNKDTEDGAKAYEDAKAKLQEFNDEVQRGNGLVETSTIKLTENTKEVIANALAKIQVEGEEEPLNIFAEIAQFDVEGLSPAAKKSLEASGIDAAEVLNDAIEAAMTGDTTAVEYLETQFQNADLQIGMRNSADLTEFINKILLAGGATDGLITSAEEANTVAQVTGRILGNAALDAEDAGEGFVDLSDALKQAIAGITSASIAEGKAASSLDNFAKSAKETGGELDGLGESARTNLQNFASFMNDAVEAAIQAGEGTPGAVARIISGIEALGAAGIDTADAFNVARDFIVNSLISINPALQTVKAELTTVPNLAGMKAIINSFYASKIAAEGWSIAINNEWQAALAALSGTAPEYQVNLEKVEKGTSRAKTALEKLQDAIRETFKLLNTDMAVRDSFSEFGQSLSSNGNTFSKFTEAGRSNIGALQDVIDNLAVKSGGDVQKFANDLASLRAALVQSGVPASGLKIIDTALKGVGKTGKSSKKDVDSFKNAMKQLAETKGGIVALKEAADKLASSIKNSLNAAFAGIDATDNVTLGWLDMADAAEAAQKQIDDATRSIASANAEIGKLTADKGKLEYQLQIALKYGDSLRANEIRAQIDQTNASIAEQSATIAENNSQIADANSALGRGGTAQDPRDVIERSRALRDMAGRYADLASWQLVSADEGADLNKIIDDQVDKFKNNALQMGYTEDEAGRVAGILRSELIKSLDDIPKDIGITIDAETKAALKDVETFSKKAKDALDKIPTTITTRWQVIEEGTNKMPTRNGYYPGEISGGYKWDAKTNKWAKLAFANGGLVPGTGGPTQDNIPAMLSSGEYVVRASAVSAYGLDFMNALNQQRVAPSRSMAVGAAGGSGSQLVYLSPEDRQLLRAAIDRPIALYTDNATIAKSANAGNALLAQRGLN